jgi:hypothetical protein
MYTFKCCAVPRYHGSCHRLELLIAWFFSTGLTPSCPFHAVHSVRTEFLGSSAIKAASSRFLSTDRSDSFDECSSIMLFVPSLEIRTLELERHDTPNLNSNPDPMFLLTITYWEVRFNTKLMANQSIACQHTARQLCYTMRTDLANIKLPKMPQIRIMKLYEQLSTTCNFQLFIHATPNGE